MNRKFLFACVSLITVLILTGCNLTATPEPFAAIQNSSETQPANSQDTNGPVSESQVHPLANPQEIHFQASDGQELMGYYYPSTSDAPAPLVVLMHWAGGDMYDWAEVAAWLQNKGLQNPFETPAGNDWWDPSWFPPLAPGRSYAVFIFSFRNCKPNPQGCREFDRAGWVLDAQSALQQGVVLEGVDPTRIVAIGSSIGADGAADACAWFNSLQPGACRGSLSLSPGDFLKISYSEMVNQLGKMDPPVPAWCLADEKEIGVCNQAEKMGNLLFRKFLIPDGGHGNELLRPGLTPSPMQTILDFLDTALKD